MATYDEIYGKRVDVLSSDPTLTAANEGQVWYNSATGTLRSVVSFGAWRAGSTRSNVTTGATSGIQTAGLVAHGYDYGPPDQSTTLSEEFNGYAWTSTPNCNTSRYQTNQTGTLTTTLSVFGALGPPPYSACAKAESFNGSTWSNESDAPANRAGGVPMVGSETAFLATGGNDNVSGESIDTTFKWDGSSWTTGTVFPTPTYGMGAAGITTAAIFYGGATNAPGSAVVSTTAVYDGSSWTTGGALPTATRGWGGKSGTSTAALAATGSPGPGSPNPFSNTTMTYDGSTWTVIPATTVVAYGGVGANQSGGSSTSAFIAAAGGPSHATKTEEYDFGVNTITNAAWASGGAYPINVLDFSGAGTTTASIAFGGRNYPGPNGPTAVSATYDGSSWTAGPSLTSARQLAASAKNGTTTAALCTGGYTTTVVNLCEEFNGSSWAEGPNYTNVAQFGDQGVGTQTAALIAGGYGGPPGSLYLDGTSTYDGSTWTALSSPSNLQDSRFGSTATGTSTAALMMAGTGGAGKIESWNGSAWSEQAEANTARTQAGSSGTSTDALYFGGEDSPTATAVTEHWNGTSWAARPNMGTASRQLASSGASSTSALAIGGSASPGNLTEEYTGEVSAVAAKTLTTS